MRVAALVKDSDGLDAMRVGTSERDAPSAAATPRRAERRRGDDDARGDDDFAR